jgi:hypothetical protein
MSLDLCMLRCPYCETRLASNFSSLDDGVWRLYCYSCEITLCVPMAKYPNIDSVCTLFMQRRVPLVPRTP